MSDAVTLEVQGFCESMLVKGEWAEFHINFGQQYPKKLSTKKDEIKAAAMAAGQQQAVWRYTEMEGNPNPHRPGENYKKRYLGSVVVGGTLDPNLAAPVGQQEGSNAPAGGGSQGPQTPTARDRSIERQVIVKAGTELWAAGKVEDEEAFFNLLDRLDVWIQVEAIPPATPAAAAAEPPAATPPDDDDIPF
jgi:hypothetical protein